MGKENMKDQVPRDLPPTPFLGHLKEQMGSPYKTRETVCMNGNPEEIHNAKARDDKGDMDVSWDIMIQQLRGNYRGQLESKSCGNLVESAAVTA
ncbi:hypothetical protein Tco_0717235 [Tanacetum coccineum]